MLNENFTITTDQLNTGSGIVNTITDLEIGDGEGSVRTYRPCTLIIPNDSGDTIGYQAFTNREYNHWIVSGTVSDYIPLRNSYTDKISNPRGEISTLIVQGQGTHISGIVASIIKD